VTVGRYSRDGCYLGEVLGDVGTLDELRGMALYGAKIITANAWRGMR
jgi:hypothetical protein